MKNGRIVAMQFNPPGSAVQPSKASKYQFQRFSSYYEVGLTQSKKESKGNEEADGAAWMETTEIITP